MSRPTRCAPDARRKAPAPDAAPRAPATVAAAPAARRAPAPLARLLALGMPVHRCADGGCAHGGLGVSRPGDPEEREAERIADRVMRSVASGAPPAPATSGPGAVSRTGWVGGRPLDPS